MAVLKQGPLAVFVGNANGRGLIRIETDASAPIAGVQVCSLTRDKEAWATALVDGFNALAAPAPRGGVTEARKPDGYAYRYETYDGQVIRFNGGIEVNGGKPIEAIPYYLGTPPAAQAQDAGPMARRRVFVDMDGVIVDFDKRKTELGLTGDEIKSLHGAYLDMEPLPGAIEAVRSAIGMGFDVWLATKPPTGVAHAYSDKAAWVFNHLPELKRKLVITHDKGMLGCEQDVLIDDRPHKANCEKFRGTLIPFTNGKTWADVLAQLRALAAKEAK